MENLLRETASDYRAFCEAAETLVWGAAEERHDVFRTGALGIILDCLEFPPGYVEENLVSAYARTVLSGMAWAEEWDRDFWDIPRRERRRCLTEGADLYRGYAVAREVRLIRRSWEHLAGEMEFFAQDHWRELNERGYPDRMAGGAVVEIGGSYSMDYVYFAVKEDRTLLVSCGCWD